MSAVTYRVRLLGSDGQEYIMSFEELRSILLRDDPEWKNAVKILRQDVNELAEIIREEMRIPKMREEIVSFLKNNANIETCNFNKRGNMWTGEKRWAWFKAKELLEAEGVIVSVKQGRGKNRLWKLKEARQ